MGRQQSGRLGGQNQHLAGGGGEFVTVTSQTADLQNCMF